MGLVLAGIVTVSTSCSRQEEPKGAGPQAKAAPGLRPRAQDFQTPWQTESEYIVTMVASDLAEMAYFAKHGRPLAVALPVEVREMTTALGQDPRYQVTVQLGEAGEVTCELPMATPIWAPVTYRPLVQALMAKLTVAGTDPTEGVESTLLKQLQTPRVEVLAKADRELSERLTGEFRSAARHEEAALLLGAFTLRETNGLFFHIQAELCRMTAHLALADGLRGERPAGLTGRLAEATLTTLYNNQADALALLATLPDGDDTGVWKRGLRMRNTADFRIIGESRTRTLWEELEWYRARAESVAIDRAWESLRLGEETQELADWSRVANALTPPIALGHVMLEISLPAELREAAMAYEIETGKKLEMDGMVSALNAEPQRCVTRQPDGTARVAVIGWGTWAAFLQRHLCEAIAANFRFMEERWGVPEEAAKFRQQMDKVFWKLRLYPFVRRQCATDQPYYKQAQDEEMALVRKSPHVVPSSAWNYICYSVPFGPIYWPPPHPFINEWHRPNPPPGTAYDPLPRMNQPSLTDRPDFVAQLERLHRLAPYDGVIIHNLLRVRDGGKSTAEQVKEAYAPMLDYYVRASHRLGTLAEKDPAEQEKWVRKAAALDPSNYEWLARIFVERKRDDDAAAAYVEWIGSETDDVAVANSAEWLIKYFERHGQKESATNLAERAARTYSAAGLRAKAHLLESRGQLKEALEFYQKSAERYSAPGPLIGFLLRVQQRGNTDYAALRESLMKEHLPGGMKKFDLAGAKAAPRTGLIVHTQTSQVTAAGLRKGDIVVAIRGYQVAEWGAFRVLREMDEDTPYGLVVWRLGKYVEIPPLAPGYRFGIDFTPLR